MTIQKLKEEVMKDKQYISRMVENEVLYSYSDPDQAQDSANTLNMAITRFIDSVITKAYEDGRELAESAHKNKVN